MGRSEFDTHMDLESSDAILLKYSINSLFSNTKLLQKREMRKDIVIELSYKGFSRASDYS